MEISNHPRFRYMAGMLTTSGPRVLSTWLEDGTPFVSYAYPELGEVLNCRASSFKREYPCLDLADAATQGCLQEMLRIASKGEPDNLTQQIVSFLLLGWEMDRAAGITSNEETK